MSDFDEAAERERLREQFERDREKREATEHMSELLLQGATMTDAHCETCGDPIFRYDGQEFCPTCQGAGGENAAEERGSAENVDDASAETTAAPDQTTTEADGQAQNTPATAQSDPLSDVQSGPSGDAQTTPATEPPAGETTGRQATPTGDAEGDHRVNVPALDPGQQQPKARETGDLHDARDSLVATLSSFARQAEATDDPRRARDALEAAREAAETLAALDRLR